jgi:hypothetical protein
LLLFGDELKIDEPSAGGIYVVGALLDPAEFGSRGLWDYVFGL